MSDSTVGNTDLLADKGTPMPHCGAAWLDMLGTGYKLLRAGFQAGPGDAVDVDASYRQWYAEQMREHDELVARTYERFHDLLGENRDAP
jgi:hypothetical protein